MVVRWCGGESVLKDGPGFATDKAGLTEKLKSRLREGLTCTEVRIDLTRSGLDQPRPQIRANRCIGVDTDRWR